MHLLGGKNHIHNLPVDFAYGPVIQRPGNHRHLTTLRHVACKEVEVGQLRTTDGVHEGRSNISYMGNT